MIRTRRVFCFGAGKDHHARHHAVRRRRGRTEGVRILAAIAACALAFPAGALLIRADRDDDEYLELASRYESALRLDAAGGEGVLIAPQWVLTAGSVAARLRDSGSGVLRINGKDRAIEAIHTHPQVSLGLVFLRDAVKDVEPSRIYRESDEGGLGIVTTGHGSSGRIGDRPPYRIVDRRKRAAINTVDRVAARTFGARIKAFEEASDLQGAATPDEIGRPAFIETKDGIFVAGIGIATEDTNGDGIRGNVGDWEIFIRVSAAADWIDATMLEAAAAYANSRTPRAR